MSVMAIYHQLTRLVWTGCWSVSLIRLAQI